MAEAEPSDALVAPTQGAPQEVVEEIIAAYGTEDPSRLLEALSLSPKLTVREKLQGVDVLQDKHGIPFDDPRQVKRQIFDHAVEMVRLLEERQRANRRLGIIGLRYMTAIPPRPRYQTPPVPHRVPRRRYY